MQSRNIIMLLCTLTVFCNIVCANDQVNRGNQDNDELPIDPQFKMGLIPEKPENWQKYKQRAELKLSNLNNEINCFVYSFHSPKLETPE